MNDNLTKDVEAKALALWEQQWKVEEAVHRFIDILGKEGWCVSVFADHTIVSLHDDDKYYRVEYSMIDEHVELQAFVEWQEVRSEWVAVQAAKSVELDNSVTLRSASPLKTWSEGDNGYVEALGIRFSDASEKDLEGDYFTKSTFFGHNRGDGAPAALNHRIPMVTANTSPEEVKYLTAAASKFFRNPVKTYDDPNGFGIIASHVLDLSDAYEAFIFGLAEAGKLSWSSGSAAHLVDREDDGQIKSWPVSEWSYTPTPAEPRLPRVSPVKSLDNQSTADETSSSEAPETSGKEVKGGTTATSGSQTQSDDSNNSIGQDESTSKGITIMSNDTNVFEDQLAKVRDELSVKADEANAATNERLDGFGKSIEQLVEMIEGMPGREKAGYSTDDGGSADSTAKSFGDFLVAVKRGDTKRLATVYGKSLTEGDGESGGYLVPDDYANSLLQIDASTSPILSRVQRIPVNTASGDWPALDQYFTPSAGTGSSAMAGGVTVASTSEMGTLTETEPSFEMLNWRVHKIGGYSQVSNELLNDSPLAIEALLRGLFNVAINAKMEYYILRGSGAGEPLGILNSNAIVDVTPDTDNTFAWADAVEMQSRFKQVGTTAPIWTIHPSMWNDILTMEIGSAGAAAFTNNLSAGASKTLLGYDIIQSEHLPQANNSGCVNLIDFNSYVLFDRQSVAIDFSKEYGFLTDSGTWRFTSRCDGMPWLMNSITLADPQGSYTVSPYVRFND